jgi:hypothetical protein
MTDKLIEVSGCEFERGIERFADRLFSGIEGESAFAMCLREHPDPTEGYMKLLDLDARATRACRWFARNVPCRYQPLPLVHYDEQEKILCSSDMHRHCVVYYSYSLRRQGFNYLKHPLFYDYACALLADPDCPNYLQGNTELLAEFPPRMLPMGRLDEDIYWRPPARVGRALRHPASTDVGLLAGA